MPTRRTLGRFCAALCLSAGLLVARPPSARAENITVTHWGGQFYGVPYAVAMDKGCSSRTA